MKRIGIVGHFPGGVNGASFGITKPYVAFFSQLGEVEIISPWENHVRDLDLLVLPGGPDVNPERYLRPGEEINLNVTAPCWVRERFDRVLLPQYVEQRIPIFGICRGHQTLAVHFGGRLIQDMWHESNGDDREKLVHKVTINQAIAAEFSINMVRQEVNSIHHQAVSMNRLPETARVLAKYMNKTQKRDFPEHIEALTYFPHYPAHTVQWHPEEIGDNLSVGLIRHLLSLSDSDTVESAMNEEVEVSN